MAGTRQPIDLVLLKGKKHLTKAEIEERKNSEIRAPNNKVKPPSYLSDELKKEFRTISKQLLEVNLITNLDVDALARFLQSRKIYQDLTNIILSDEKNIMNKDLLNNQDKFFKQCRSAAADMGLTISSRQKLIVPQIEKKENKFAAYLSNRGGKAKE